METITLISFQYHWQTWRMWYWCMAFQLLSQVSLCDNVNV